MANKIVQLMRRKAVNGAHFNGPEYSHKEDHSRLLKQHERILRLMMDGEWRTVKEISRITRDPENSVQAQLRHLRKPRFGAFIVSRRKVEKTRALYEYHVRERKMSDPPYQGSIREKLNVARRAIREAIHLLEDGEVEKAIAILRAVL